MRGVLLSYPKKALEENSMPDLDMGAPYDVMVFCTPNEAKQSEEIFISESGDMQIGWNGDSPSHRNAWKNVSGKRIPCMFYIGYGFMTDDEIWEQRQKHPRDSL
jgi:hypothetical protein